MMRKRWFVILSFFVATFLLVAFSLSITVTVARAAPFSQGASGEQEDGQEYVVQPGDWLSTISEKFYGSVSAWQVIIDATNAKAATDERFVVIEDPDKLEVGQLLWIPDTSAESASETAKTPITESVTAASGVAENEAISSTEPAASSATSETVRFVEPLNGSKVLPHFEVVMAAEGLKVEPAGEIHEGAGHFHILVDTDFVQPGELIPLDSSHLHFGKGQITTTLDLKPGVHTLRLQFADGAHFALDGAQYRDIITVTVANATSTPAVTPSTTVTTTSATTSTTTSTDSITVTESVSPTVRFVEPQDGSELPPSFEVTMAAEGLTVEPAGEIHDGAGHFHILIDTDFVPPGELIPLDKSHLHFGKGQVTTTLALEPGVHTLRLQFADGAHIALDGPEYRDIITVTVGSGQ